MEQLSFNFYNFIVLLATLQGLLLAFVFLFNKKYKKKSNLALGLCLLAYVFLGTGSICYHTGLMNIYPIIRYSPIYYNLLIPIGLYYTGQYIIHPTHQFTTRDYWFIAPLIIVIILKPLIFIAFLVTPQFILEHKEYHQYFNYSRGYLAIIYLVGVILVILQKIRKYHILLLANFSEIENKNLYWLRNNYILFIPLSLLWLFKQTYDILGKTAILFSIPLGIGSLLIIYYLAYLVISKREVFEISNFDKNEIPSIKPILSNKTEEHYQNLLQLIQKEKLYQDAQLSMDALAEKTGLSNGYLSKIINQKEGKNFYDFINSYRVKEVKANLTHPDYAHYSILGIGLKAGFKSKSTFNAVFKKMTGMTPSAFKKI